MKYKWNSNFGSRIDAKWNVKWENNWIGSYSNRDMKALNDL